MRKIWTVLVAVSATALAADISFSPLNVGSVEMVAGAAYVDVTNIVESASVTNMGAVAYAASASVTNGGAKAYAKSYADEWFVPKSRTVNGKSLANDIVIDMKPLKDVQYDFNYGSNFTRRLYVALTNVIYRLGGSVKNPPQFTE